MNVLICDPISPKGIALFQSRPEFKVTVLEKPLKEAELLPIVKDVEAMVVRSETKVTRKVIEAAPKLRVVGRAGVGIDNVDVDAATERGVVVMNTPGGNTVTTAELAFFLLGSLARHIAPAAKSMTEGKWDRKLFSGVEIHGKTLGVLGMGRIGGEVAKRALAFGMRVLAYDPFLTEAAREATRRGTGAGRGFDLSRGGFHHRAHAGDRPDARDVERRRIRKDEAGCAHRERGARGNHRGERFNRGAGIKESGGRGAGCFFGRAIAGGASVAASCRTWCSLRTWARARRRRRRSAASRWRKSSRRICSRAKCATR